MIPPKPADAPTYPAESVAASAGIRPSRRAVLAAAVWTLVVAGTSSGVTLAVVSGDGPRTTAVPASSPSIWQDTRTYPDDAAQGPEAQQTSSPSADVYTMGQKAKSGGVTVVVKKVRESPTLTIDDIDTPKTLKAGDGAKYVIVESTVYNDGRRSFDPVCGGGISQGLVDAEGRTFDMIQDAYRVKENSRAKVCFEEVQPGFKRDVVFIYKLPAEAHPAQWAFSGARGEVEGDLAAVRIEGPASG